MRFLPYGTEDPTPDRTRGRSLWEVRNSPPPLGPPYDPRHRATVGAEVLVWLTHPPPKKNHHARQEKPLTIPTVQI